MTFLRIYGCMLFSSFIFVMFHYVLGYYSILLGFSCGFRRSTVEIKDRIVSLRNKAGLSQVKLAKGISVSAGNVSDWETGRAKPGADALRNLSRFFNVSIDWIVTGYEAGQDGNTLQDEIQNRKSAGSENSNMLNYNEEKRKKLKQVDVTEEEEIILQIYRDFSLDDKEFFKNMMAARHAQYTGSMKRKGRLSDTENNEEAASAEYSEGELA